MAASLVHGALPSPASCHGGNPKTLKPRTLPLHPPPATACHPAGAPPSPPTVPGPHTHTPGRNYGTVNTRWRRNACHAMTKALSHAMPCFKEHVWLQGSPHHCSTPQQPPTGLPQQWRPPPPAQSVRRKEGEDDVWLTDGSATMCYYSRGSWGGSTEDKTKLQSGALSDAHDDAPRVHIGFPTLTPLTPLTGATPHTPQRTHKNQTILPILPCCHRCTSHHMASHPQALYTP